jgi:hypothetical protein
MYYTIPMLSTFSGSHATKPVPSCGRWRRL